MESAGHDLKQLESHLFHLKKNADFFRKVVIPVKNNMRQLHKKQPAAMNSNLTKTRKFENFHVSPIICGVCVCVQKQSWWCTCIKPHRTSIHVESNKYLEETT